jgi:hypothetical protein
MPIVTGGFVVPSPVDKPFVHDRADFGKRFHGDFAGNASFLEAAI